jgi:hypothetical protein
VSDFVEQPKIMTAIEKLVLAGEQAGFTVEQMIQMLQTGATVETLLSLDCVSVVFAPLHNPLPAG